MASFPRLVLGSPMIKSQDMLCHFPSATCNGMSSPAGFSRSYLDCWQGHGGFAASTPASELEYKGALAYTSILGASETCLLQSWVYLPANLAANGPLWLVHT